MPAPGHCAKLPNTKGNSMQWQARNRLPCGAQSNWKACTATPASASAEARRMVGQRKVWSLTISASQSISVPPGRRAL